MGQAGVRRSGGRWGRAAAGGVVVGYLDGDWLRLAREGVTAADQTQTATHGMRWESGAGLGEPLERHLHWRPGEPVFLAVETPPLAGSTEEVTIDASGPDRRAAYTAAQWQARERIREAVARYFDTTLERVRLLSEEVAALGPAGLRVSIVAAVTEGEEPRILVDVPPDVPEVSLVLLPLFLANLIPPGEVMGLVVVESRQVTVVVADGRRVVKVRNVPLGSDLLVEHVRSHLGCSPASAGQLLTRADEGRLPSEALRVLTRVLRSLLPLYAGAWSAIGSDGFAAAATPKRVLVAGRWPALFSRAFCRPQFLRRCAPALLSVRPLVAGSPGETVSDPLLALLLAAGRRVLVPENAAVPATGASARQMSVSR